MNVSVIVPAFGRPNDLMRCLGALCEQAAREDEIIVVVRSGDQHTLDRIEEGCKGFHIPGLRVVETDQPGLLAAYNLGLAHSTADIVCFIDHDAESHPDRLARIKHTFITDASIGGIGGRDVCHVHGSPDILKNDAASMISWYGRTSPVQHRGADTSQPVSALQGGNLCWRRVAIEGIRFDERLRGINEPYHCALAFSLTVAERGWRLIYDPDLCVDYLEIHKNSQRDPLNELAHFNAAFNLSLAMFEGLPPLRQWLYRHYAQWIGTAENPGLVRAITSSLSADADHPRRRFQIGRRALSAARRAATPYSPSAKI